MSNSFAVRSKLSYTSGVSFFFLFLVCFCFKSTSGFHSLTDSFQVSFNLSFHTPADVLAGRSDTFPSDAKNNLLQHLVVCVVKCCSQIAVVQLKQTVTHLSIFSFARRRQ